MRGKKNTTSTTGNINTNLPTKHALLAAASSTTCGWAKEQPAVREG